MTWYEAATYCNWLSKREGIPEDQWCYASNETGTYGPGMRPRDNYLSLTGYRLPTEAEWEFACRAGATTVRPFGETAELLGAYAWHEDNSAQRTHPVASLKPNDFGLFDTLGNVWEWCQNRVYQKELPADVEDCSAVSNQELRALRGCSYDDDARLARAANRFNHHPDSRAFYGGFRIARTIAN